MTTAVIFGGADVWEQTFQIGWYRRRPRSDSGGCCRGLDVCTRNARNPLPTESLALDQPSCGAADRLECNTSPRVSQVDH